MNKSVDDSRELHCCPLVHPDTDRLGLLKELVGLFAGFALCRIDQFHRIEVLLEIRRDGSDRR